MVARATGMLAFVDDALDGLSGPNEEAIKRARFGEAYDSYVERTRQVLPKCRRVSARSVE